MFYATGFADRRNAKNPKVNFFDNIHNLMLLVACYTIASFGLGFRVLQRFWSSSGYYCLHMIGEYPSLGIEPQNANYSGMSIKQRKQYY